MAYNSLAMEHDTVSLDSLLAIFPELAGDDDDLKAAADADTAVHLALYSGKKGNVPVLAVFYESIWSPAIVRRQGNKHKLATCFLLSCASHPWGCIHAQAVNEFNRLEAAASSAAAADLAEALKFGPSGYLDDDEEEQDDDEEQTPGRSGGPPPPAEVAPPTPLPPRVRRTRNMFPCPAEVQHCNRYSDFIDSCVQAGEPKTMDIVHAEAMCLRCNRPREVDTRVEPEEAVLFTIRGRAKIFIGSWYCIDCGISVEYDGALNGLFVATRDTVYARTFLDAMLELCVIARSTMAAASEFLASLLRNTAAYAEKEPGLARQLLSIACGEFSHTLIIPDAAFRCYHCGAEEGMGGRFQCVICDGQVLSVLQQHVVEMLRPSMNAPRVDFSLVFACAVRSAKMRRLVRNRVRAAITDDTSLTTAEASAWPVFAAARLGVPPARGRDAIAARTNTEKANALLWSSSIVFSTFYAVIASAEREQAPVVVGAPAGGAADNLAAAADNFSDGDDLEEDATSSAGSLVDLVAASGSPDGSTAELGEDTGDIPRQLRQLSLVGQANNGEDVEADEREQANEAADANEAAVPEVAADADEATDADEVANVDHLVDADDPANPEEHTDVKGPADAAGPVSTSGRSVAAGPSAVGGRTRSTRTAFAAKRAHLSRTADAAGPRRVMPGSFEVGQLPVEGPTVNEVSQRASDDGSHEELENKQSSGPCTTDSWKTPLHYLADPLAPGADKGTVCDPEDPLSPLTPRALAATAPITPYTGTAQAAPATQEPLVIVSNIPIRLWDLRRMAPTVMLHDEAMNAYAALLQQREETWAATERRPVRFHFFNSFMFSTLTSNYQMMFNYEAVFRWTRHVDLKEYSAVFVPINQGAIHWVLEVVYMQRHHVEMYDSMGFAPDWMVACLVRWAKDDLSAHGYRRGTWTWTKMRCRQQEGSKDCGVFTLKSMDYMSRGLQQSSMVGNMDYYRRRMVAELLSKTLI